MDNGLKQRLVGAAVLLALGVLFLPVLFEPENRQTIDRTSQIPPEPTIDPVAIEEPQDLSHVPPVRSPEDMYEYEEDNSASANTDSSSIVTKNSEQSAASNTVTSAEDAKSTDESGSAIERAPTTQKASNTEVKPESEKPVVSETKPDRDILDDRGIPKAWAVQVASFTGEGRAIALRDELLESDYPAFTRTVSTSQGKVIRVYVGPKISKQTAQSLKSELDKKLKLDTLVVTFRPR